MKPAEEKPLKPEKIPQATRAANTDTAAKFIIESERIQMAKKMERLKLARLEMEASAPPVPVVAPPKKRAAKAI